MVSDAVVGAGVYERLLRDDAERLAPAVRALHVGRADGRGVGWLEVRYRHRWLARAAALFGLPVLQGQKPLDLRVVRRPGGELWTRNLGDRRIVTEQRAGERGVLVECFGPLEVEFHVGVVGDSLAFSSVGSALRLRRRRVRLPHWSAPRITGPRPATQAPSPSSSASRWRCPWQGRSSRTALRWSRSCEVGSLPPGGARRPRRLRHRVLPRVEGPVAGPSRHRSNGAVAAPMWDFVVEDRIRVSLGGVYPGERVTHGLMAIVYGAMLACLIPVLRDWWDEPTGLVAVAPDAPMALRVGLTGLGVGIGLSGLRDLYAASEGPHGAWPWAPPRPRPAGVDQRLAGN